MACPAILTGDQFLTRVLTHIDCQAAFLGSYGWQSLGQPGSLAASMMTGLLTLFIALFGIRLLFGPTPGARDLVGDILKIGIVLTLAFSWPAFRTLIHDVVLEGPAEIAATAGSPVMPQDASLITRLQETDNAIQRLIEQGSGRQSGAYVDSTQPGGTFRAQALEDESSYGLARLFFLTGVLGSFGLLRIIAGLLLAIAPLAAGMLLFEATRGLFAGWMRGLVLSLVGAAAVTVVVAGQLTILQPWLADALRLRALGYATPSAPTELFALTLAFALIQFGAIWFMGKIAFTRGWISLPIFPERGERGVEAPRILSEPMGSNMARSRSQVIVDSVETQLRREEGFGQDRAGYRYLNRPANASDGSELGQAPSINRLGNSWRRSNHRRSGAARRRDEGQ